MKRGYAHARRRKWGCKMGSRRDFLKNLVGAAFGLATAPDVVAKIASFAQPRITSPVAEPKYEFIPLGLDHLIIEYYSRLMMVWMDFRICYGNSDKATEEFNKWKDANPIFPAERFKRRPEERGTLEDLMFGFNRGGCNGQVSSHVSGSDRTTSSVYEPPDSRAGGEGKGAGQSNVSGMPRFGGSASSFRMRDLVSTEARG